MSALTKIDFHGATLLAVKGATPADTLVAMKLVVEGMGLDWGAQHKKLVAHPVLATCVSVREMQIPGDDQRREVTFLPLNRLNFWLATIHPDRIKDAGIRARVIQYQTECADALFAHFFAGRLAERDLTAEVAGGVFKGVLTKHDKTVLLPAIKAEMVEMMREILPALMSADPRVAVGEYVSVVEVLDAEGVPAKRRNKINRRLGYAFRERCLKEGVSARRCPRTKTWLFPVNKTNEWMARFGRTLVRDHLAALTGQGVLKLAPKGV